MPGRFFICMLLMVFGIFGYTQALAEEISPEAGTGKSSCYWSNEEKQAFDSMLRSFALYESLLDDIKEHEGYRITVHGENVQDLMNYLDEGFEAELAANIIEAYLQWVPELQKMAVMPCDGIPVLNNNDMQALTCFHPDQNTIIFQRSYEDCYSKGDSYLFSVTLNHSSQCWRIKELHLEESSQQPLDNA